MINEVAQLVVYGVVLGSIIALGAIGVSLLYGILRFAHFAHGDLMTVGAYLALFFFATLNLPMALAFPLALAGAAALAVAVDQTLYRRLRRTSPIILLISSFGVALVLRSLVQLVWGPNNQVYQSGIRVPYRVLGGVAIQPDHITIVLGAVALVVALHLFLQRTRTGKAMRAMADDPDLARVSGIDTERVVVWTWILGAGLAAAAGIFLGMDTRLHPVMGFSMLLAVFAAAILGGLGKPYGAIAGGLVIGLGQELSTLFLNPDYKPAIAFALLVLMLVVRPQGLFGSRVRWS